MQFKTYQEVCVPQTMLIQWSNFEYYTLGLIGEAKEFADSLTPDELGDVIWYYAALGNTIDFHPDFEAFDFRNLEGYAPDQILSISCELAQAINKYRRALSINPQKAQQKFNSVITLMENLGEYLRKCCSDIPERILQQNWDKLTARQEEGTLADREENV